MKKVRVSCTVFVACGGLDLARGRHRRQLEELATLLETWVRHDEQVVRTSGARPSSPPADECRH